MKKKILITFVLSVFITGLFFNFTLTNSNQKKLSLKYLGIIAHADSETWSACTADDTPSGICTKIPGSTDDYHWECRSVSLGGNCSGTKSGTF